jgi:hypothetical protein
MGKYSNLTILKRVKARANYACHSCGKEILFGEVYYREHIEDRFLHSLHARAYCSCCGEKIIGVKES